MKKSMVFFGVLSAIVFALVFSGCKKGSDSAPTYTVTYDSQGGSTVAPVTGSANGAKVTKPAADPTKDGYDFAGWYKEAACTNAWNFAVDRISADATLYAKWTLAAPSVPANVTALSESNKTITVSWNAVSGASSYKVYRSETENGAYTEISSVNAPAVKYTQTSGLDYLKLYYYKVSAVNALGESAQSGAVKELCVGPTGGYVFYVNPNAATDGWQYLEAAPADLTGKYEWGAYGKDVSGTETGIGKGKANTTVIVKALAALRHPETGKAAQAADAYRLNGYNDWFLPSKDELNLMYTTLKVNGKGSFGKGLYWSSSQSTTDYAWYQRFSSGYQIDYSKPSSVSVRVVRSF